MSAANKDDSKTYEKLIKRFPLRPIRDDEQNEDAAEICDMLIDRGDSLSQAESDYLEVLTDLVAKYESRWDEEFTEMTPRELIQYLMEQNELAQKDLVREFGSPSRVSEFLKGERRLSLEQARRLADRFSLNIAVLLDKDEKPKSTGKSAGEFKYSTANWVSLRNLLAHPVPVTYRSFFNAFTHVADEQDKYVLQLLQRPIENEDFSKTYCKLFNEINLWLIALKSNRNSTTCPFVAENVDVDSYMAFLRPEYMAWENSICKGPKHKHKRWLKKHAIGTYGDFLQQIHLLAEQRLSTNSTFWSRYIHPEKGQAAFEQFAIDLFEELSVLV